MTINLLSIAFKTATIINSFLARPTVKKDNMAGFNIEIQPLSEEENARLLPLYDAIEKYNQSFIKANPGNCLLPAAYEQCKDKIKNFEIKTDDICLLTYPKCGTHWMQELIALLKNDFDFEKTKAIPIPQRGAMLDFQFLLDAIKKEGVPFDQIAKAIGAAKSPRLVVSHLPFCLLPDDLFDKSKVIICLRNPKDTVVSKFHFEKMVKPFEYAGDFETYFETFMEGLVLYGSYFEYLKEAWKKRHHPNVCILFFEEMKKDMASNLRKVAAFLGKSFTDEQIEKSVEFLSFKKMKERGGHIGMQALIQKEGSSGNIMRKGEAGDWKNYFTDEMKKRMDEAIEKHLTPIGLEFKFE